MLFDRFVKIKKAIPDGAVHTGTKQVLPLLRGTLDKDDLPAAVVEPANLEELARLFDFAGEKEFKIAISHGLDRVSVSGMRNQILVLTSRLKGTLSYSPSRQSLRADAGIAVESLAVELASHGQRWLPLHPVPAGESLGSLISTGWEGFRNWKHGGTLAHVRAIEWMGFDGRLYVTGGSMPGIPDVSGLIFNSRGCYGVITSLELAVSPLPERRTLAILELPSAGRAIEALDWLRAAEPEPETVVYLNELATEILRSANDGCVRSSARNLIAAEWSDEIFIPEGWADYSRCETDASLVTKLWQDIFRLPKAAARLSPERTTARLKLPAGALEDLEERARDLSRDFNLGVSMWGTLNEGHFHVWILQPDGELRTVRQAADLLQKLLEDAVRLGGCLVDTSPRTSKHKPDTGADEYSSALAERLLQQCDPLALRIPLRS